MAFSMAWLDAPVEDRALERLDLFRRELYGCFTARADALFEPGDALLCADAPVTTLVGLSLAPEHRRGHGALHDGVNHGRVGFARVRRSLAGLPLPRAADGRLILAVDVSNWLRPDAATSPERLFCHACGRGKGQAQMIPGWPYSVVAAREPGRTSWTAVLDAVRLGPGDDETEVTAPQVRDVVTRLIEAGQQKEGDPDILVVSGAGYDVTRLACLPGGLPAGLLGRLPGPGAVFPRPGARPWRERPPVPARSRAQARGPGGLAGPAGHHGHRDDPPRHRRGSVPGPAAPPADQPGRPGAPRRPAAGHRRDINPAHRRSPPRRPRPEAGVAVVVTNWCVPCRRGPALAGVPASFRS